MTLDDRALRLTAAYRLTTRQARFLTLVTLISGYCLRRQYGEYARIALGKNAAEFLDGLVHRGLVSRHLPRRNRSFIYHVNDRALYRALEIEHNRHRRPAPPTRQARQLMLLDYALAQPDATWYATESEKVELFTGAFHVPPQLLPARIYRGDEGATTTRHFVLKQPIYRRPNDPAVYFVCLGLDTTGQALGTFLAHHDALLKTLPAWHVVIVHPPFVRSAARAWQATVLRTHFLAPPRLSPHDARELHAYFRVKHALAIGTSDSTLTIDHTYDQRRRRFARSPHEALYSYWRDVGGPQLPQDHPPDFSGWRPTGALTTYELQHSYDCFGAFPGIA